MKVNLVCCNICSVRVFADDVTGVHFSDQLPYKPGDFGFKF